MLPAASAVVAAILLIALAALSAREKARQRDREIASIRGAELPQAKLTPFSQGLVDLVAVAGGIYLSLVMVASFVGYDMPGKVSFLGNQFDPIALLSVLLALVEPFLSKLFERA